MPDHASKRGATCGGEKYNAAHGSADKQELLPKREL